jgi:Predicted phosphoesterase or phosphohydrolase
MSDTQEYVEQYPILTYHPDLFQEPPAWLTQNTWMISDTHFFHKNVALYCGRPENWADLVCRNWISSVAPTDTVFHLGDVALGGREPTIELMRSLPGVKYLLRGNHDRKNPNHWEACGFAGVLEENFLAVRMYGMALIFSHSPMELVGWGRRPVVNIHGHVHNNPYLYENDPHYINISLDVMDFKLVPLYDILTRARRQLTI